MKTQANKTSNSKRVARSLHAHLVIALSLGALIYILAVTGTLSVFNREFQRWEQPSVPEMVSISPEAAEKAATAVFLSEEIPSTHLYINFPSKDLPRTVITTDTQAFFADENGDYKIKESFPWTQFLLDLHYYLHLPQILGLTVVGSLGAFLLAMALSGFMAHPRIFRDAFTFRRGSGLLPLVDMHNRLSVWTSPFHISNALTGALLGLASVFGFAIAALNFEGDIDAVFSPVFGAEPVQIEGRAPLANIAGPLKIMASEFPDLPPTFFILHDPATKSQHINVIAAHTDRLIFGDYYNFNADGEYQGNVGISDGTIGQQLIGSVYNIHFGNWGGSIVKVAYAIFGVMLCIIIASGLRMYFMRRKQKGFHNPRLEASWEAVVWGTPAMLAITLLASILIGLEGLMLVSLFWLGLVILTAISAYLAKPLRTRSTFKGATALLLLLIVAIQAVMYSNSILTAAMVPVSTCLVVLSMVLLFDNLRPTQSMLENPQKN